MVKVQEDRASKSAGVEMYVLFALTVEPQVAADTD